MPPRPLLLPASILLLAACGPEPDLEDAALDIESATPGLEDAIQAPPAGLEDAAPGDTLIALERRGCFGLCPVYRVEVDGGGTVRYHGERNVATVGERSWTVPRDAVARLIAASRALGYAALPTGLNHEDWSDCEAIATDHPSAITTVRVGGDAHQIHHDYGCVWSDQQDDLEAFEGEIDRVLGTERWVRG